LREAREQKVKERAHFRWRQMTGRVVGIKRIAWLPASAVRWKGSRARFAALGRHNAEFGQVSAQGIAKHRALAHQQLPGPVQHQTFVLIGTNRIDSRVTASQIAAASFASFLPRLR
jgi:hypothetical protein